ncbi:MULTISPECIES: HIT family protein [Acidiplasma]|jgi:bis(5'-nucleosidyl)-tetraphosphatase/histidine triad (HIT) family protein|uniref:HIT family hydrolase n=2 Tax=Acidiplasma TaxID=507753 RepID=A0A0Q0VJN0_9ARCH|nr:MULTISPECIES: HIT family protein [Acidiplasma]KJE48995.1 HIT family hydrolase [Acidiplasma sp. MBA-1]KPV45890.1 HIT family hydrolase [Acidiplasma aeolicum]KQB33705.1 HIT family hydrolase [Acidiplasma cupricumulans]KQB34321.1 HIT family hydrolase [Acidiplasma aeolicum]WMT54425.1 MAG: HIT family protein [Acidiplasma sp.]
MYDETCVFCREIIRNGKAAFVYEDEYVLAFMDNAPIEEGHVLVIPREHYENIFDIDKEIYIKIQLTVKKIAIAIKNALKCDGINIGQNNGRVANQVVMHYHTHIIPRYYRKRINWEREVVDMADLEIIAEKIRSALKEVKI